LRATSVIFTLRGQNLEDSDNLPHPDILSQEIVDDLEAALEQFRAIANAIQPCVSEGTLQFKTA